MIRVELSSDGPETPVTVYFLLETSLIERRKLR